MRILHVLPSVARAYGGPTQSLLGYIRGSRSASIELDVAAPMPTDADVSWWREQLPDQRLTLFRSFGGGAFVTSPELSRWVWRHGAGYDVIHVHALQNPVSSAAMRTAAVRGWRFVVRTIGMLSEFTFTHRRQLAKRAWYAGIDRPSLRRASGLHFTTLGERDEGLRRVAALGVPAFVVPPPFTGAPSASAPAARSRLVFVGRIHPVKNLERLLASWKVALTRLPRAELVIAGDGDEAYVAELRALVDRLGVSASVSFPGFVNGAEKNALLASSHAFALVSHHENFGVAALEAMAAGIPLVLSPTVHLAPFASSQGLAVVVDPRDEGALGDAIVRCLTDATLSTHCRQSGARIVGDTFSVGAVGRSLRDMYEAICSKPAPARARLGAPSTWW